MVWALFKTENSTAEEQASSWSKVICRIFSMCYNQLKAGEYTGIIIHVLSLTIMQKVCRSQPKWAMLSTIISCMAARLMV